MFICAFYSEKKFEVYVDANCQFLFEKAFHNNTKEALPWMPLSLMNMNGCPLKN